MRTKSIVDSIKSMIPCGNATTLVYEPGNGTRYEIVLTDLRAMGEGYIVSLLTTSPGTCMRVADSGGYITATYVRSKLGVGLGDAVILAELIAHLTGRKADDATHESSYL